MGGPRGEAQPHPEGQSDDEAESLAVADAQALLYSAYVEKEPRVTIAVRISPSGLRAVDQRTEEEDRSRSEMVRRMLAYAAQKMPKGWKP